MLTIAIYAALLTSFAGGVVLLLAATRANGSDIWWPLLLGTKTRTLPKSDRVAILERLATIEDSWREPILLAAREQERDSDIVALIERALEKDA